MFRRIVLSLLTLAFFVAIACLILVSRRAQLPIAPPQVGHAAVVAAQNRLAAALTPKPILAFSTQSPETPNASQQNTPSNQDVVSLSENDVNTVLAGGGRVAKDLAKAGISDAQVAFIEPNQLDCTGVITKDGASQSVTVEGVLITVGAGSIKFTAQSVRLGDLPVPEQTLDKLIRRESGKLLGLAISSIPLTIEQVRIQNHQLILTGQHKDT